MRGEHAGEAVGSGSFDGLGHVLRARRLADLSQRDLAVRLGVSRAAVGRIESGDTALRVDVLVRILSLAGLRLAVLDAAGEEVRPVPDDTLRDNGGRRFPSHLDATGPDVDEPLTRGVDPRRGLPPALGWYLGRKERDRRRTRTGVVPTDHPTVRSERERLRLRRERVAEQGRARAAARGPVPECTCLDDCFEAACLSPCPCQCEPASWLRPPGHGVFGMAIW